MLGAIFRFLLRWIPFLGRFFPVLSPPKTLPRARVAIIGAGTGGCCAAYFLRELGGKDLEIHVWQKRGVPVGGRAAVVSFADHVYETGAGIFHTSNKHLGEVATKFGLAKKSERVMGTNGIGIFNGRNFCFRLGGPWRIINSLKVLWHYGLSAIRMELLVRSMLSKFTSIYRKQENGQAFATVPDMLKVMGGEDMYKLTQISAEDYFIGKQGLSEKLVKELVTGALYIIYGQNAQVNAFTALASLVAMQDRSLWSVVGGNRKISESVLEASGGIFHEREVSAIRRMERDGKVSYVVQTEGSTPSTGESTNEFDVVIVANPLNVSNISFENFPMPIYTEASTTPYQRTVVTLIKGKPNPSFYGLDSCKTIPNFIFTTDLQRCPVQFNGVHLHIPSEVQASQSDAPLSQVSAQVWRVSTPKPLTREEKQLMFETIEDEVTIDWQAYPKYNPPEEFPPFILDDGVFYINGIEKAASAMEMSAIGAKNVALLAREYLLKTT